MGVRLSWTDRGSTARQYDVYAFRIRHTSKSKFVRVPIPNKGTTYKHEVVVPLGTEGPEVELSFRYYDDDYFGILDTLENGMTITATTIGAHSYPQLPDSSTWLLLEKQDSQEKGWVEQHECVLKLLRKWPKGT